jgi:indolepyruvate ferredoxin oxidoreductase alpha subunit
MGIQTTVLDPVEDIQKAIETVYRNLQEEGVKLIVFRRVCSTYETKESSSDQLIKAKVDPEKCIGEVCGCDRFCSKVLGCPGILYDEEKGKAYIREDACNGCSLCVQLCPRQAISLVERAVE